ncbi:MAG: hypothetical protein LBG84_07580 [Treponema sp.]|nr:hypothetical protein [Treponema sp.]
MTVSRKAAFSLLISAALGAGFSVLAFTGLFNLIESRFYNPAIARSLNREVQRDAGVVQDFLASLTDLFAGVMLNDPVKKSFLPDQAADDILERSRLYGTLMETQQGLQSVRFVDAGGLRLHFSTDSADVEQRTGQSITYKNYDESIPYVPYRELAVLSGEKPRITLDQTNDRLVFSFPFHDSMEVYRGTALYSLSIRAVAEKLVVEGRIKVGDNLSVISSPPGIVSGLPRVGKDAFTPVIGSVWRERIQGPTVLDSGNTAAALALVSAKTTQEIMVGRVVDEGLFHFPPAMKVILLAAAFITIYLSVFLLFNLKPDRLTVIQNRLKGLQLSLIREYYERKGEMDWDHVRRELEQRREDVRREVKRGIKTPNPALLGDIDSQIDRSWEEILAAIGGGSGAGFALDEDELRRMVNRLVLSAQAAAPSVSGETAAARDGAFPREDAVPEETPAPEEPEVLEELEELGEPEDPGEPEEVEVLEELEEPESLEGFEELEAPEDKEVPASPLPASLSGVSRPSSGDLASQIEFDLPPAEEEGTPKREIEVVSPFNFSRSWFDAVTSHSPGDGDGEETSPPGELEELREDSCAVLVQPFRDGNWGELETLPGAETGGEAVIRQKNGLSYVDKQAKAPDRETANSLDPGLKILVDSVIGRNEARL